MAGGHSGNKTPIYYSQETEAEFFRKTPKHVLYALARDYALQVNEDSGDVVQKMDRHLAEMAERIDILKANGLIA